MKIKILALALIFNICSFQLVFASDYEHKIPNKNFNFELGAFVLPGINFEQYMPCNCTLAQAKPDAENAASSNSTGINPQANFIIGEGVYFNLEPVNTSKPRWHFSASVFQYAEQLAAYYFMDNAIYWNLIAPSEIKPLKFDIGLDLRVGSAFLYATFMLYMNLDYRFVNTDLHLKFASKNGVFMDITNQEVKLSLAYEFGSTNFQQGIELGYQFNLKKEIFVVGGNMLANSGHISLYGKW